MSLNNKKIVSLENIDDVNETYKLRSPKRGKIYRGATFNAFNRENLGSIPKSSEIILFKDKSSESKPGFLIQSQRFPNRNNIIYNNHPYEDEIKNRNNKNILINSNPSFSSKGYCNGFLSKSERFDDSKLFYEKYYPSPGLYKEDKFSILNEISNNNRYKSLYNTKHVKSLKIMLENPGPGAYNPINNNIITERYKYDNPNSFFASKENRFGLNKLKDEDGNDLIPGPGKYFYEEKFPYVKEQDKSSYFFKQSPKKQENLLEIVLNIPKIENFKIPGPGAYNLRTEFVKVNKISEEKEEDSNTNQNDQTHKNTEMKDKNKGKIYFSERYYKPKEFSLTEKKKESKSKSPNLKKKEYQFKMPEYVPRKGIRSIFISQSPKEDYIKLHHIPGPSYYNPILIPTKKSFNSKIDNLWI
jgi:hypothetical protein